jgi:acyl-CoA synthetase (NDP forming)
MHSEEKLSESTGPVDRLDSLLAPRSIAIVGATGKPGSPFGRPLEFLLSHFDGEVHPVNPKYEEIRGARCYPSLTAIERPVDLAMILVPAGGVEPVVEECCRLGVGTAIIYSSGFAELGPTGRRRQERLVEIARGSNLRLLGPNCQGVIYASRGLVATWTSGVAGGLSEPSGLAYVGQSGAVGGAVLQMARDQGTGLSAWVSVGNEADLTLCEVASALVERDDISVIAAYVESLVDGEQYVRLAARCAELDKGLVLLRAGITEIGRKAAISHTGAMLSADETFDAVARQYGAEVVMDLDQLLDVSAARLRFGRGVGRRVAVLTSSGGAGSLAADHLTLAGLDVPELRPEVQRELRNRIPAFGAVANPVDVTAQLFFGDDPGFIDVGRLLAHQDDIDQLVVVLTVIVGDQATAIVRRLVALAQEAGKPLHFCWLVGEQDTEEARRLLREAGVGSYSAFARLATVARAITRMPRIRRSAVPDRADGHFQHSEDRMVGEWRAGALLDAAGVPRPRSRLVHSPDEAAAAVTHVGGRAVCKVQSPEILHKSDVGGVVLDVTAARARDVVAELLSAHTGRAVDGVLIQEQIRDGLELIVGIVRQRPDLPPLLSVGLGGIVTEVLGDVASEALPCDHDDIEHMLSSLKAGPLLHGFRNRTGYDVPAAVDAIFRIAQASELLGERLEEFEVNPLIVLPAGRGAVAADVLIRLTQVADSSSEV